MRHKYICRRKYTPTDGAMRNSRGAYLSANGNACMYLPSTPCQPMSMQHAVQLYILIYIQRHGLHQIQQSNPSFHTVINLPVVFLQAGYNIIRDAILTCAQSQLNLLHRTNTKKWQQTKK